MTLIVNNERNSSKINHVNCLCEIMKTSVKNRLTVICLQALNWETIQRLRAGLTQRSQSPLSFTQMYMAHFSLRVLSNKSIYICRARHEQIKCVISICTTASFDLLTCRAWILPLWIRFTKTKVIWHVIQFGVGYPWGLRYLNKDLSWLQSGIHFSISRECLMDLNLRQVVPK